MQVKQNDALRVVCNVDRHYSAIASQTQTSIPWLGMSRMERCCVETYKDINAVSAKNINLMFSRRSNHDGLRSSAQNTFVPLMNRTKFPESYFVNRSCKYWGDDPISVRQSHKLIVLRQTLREEIILFYYFILIMVVKNLCISA